MLPPGPVCYSSGIRSRPASLPSVPIVPSSVRCRQKSWYKLYVAPSDDHSHDLGRGFPLGPWPRRSFRMCGRQTLTPRFAPIFHCRLAQVREPRRMGQGL